MRTMLEVTDLKAGYGDKLVLDGLSMTIHEGEFVSLIGFNGAGKSTLIRCICGLVPMSGGEIEICGRKLSKIKAKERAQMVSVVPQSFTMDFDFTVEDVVMMGRNPYQGFGKRKDAEDRAIVQDAMEKTNTWIFRQRLYNELSGGQRQRVILARAIAQQPDIILLDEPTSALDLHHQIEMMELIRKLNREGGLTVLAVLHDINLASRFSNRIAMLRDGRIMADGDPSEVITKANMELLYDMKLMVRENILFHKPEVIPIRVMGEEQIEEERHVHVIGGADGATNIMEELQTRGYRVTAGVLSTDSTDYLVAKALGIEALTVPPFTAVTEEVQVKHLAMMQDADVVYVSATPFGEANIESLRGLSAVPAQVYVNRYCLQNDHTGGCVAQVLAELGDKAILVEEQDSFLRTIAQL